MNDIKLALADRAETVCQHLLPNGKIDGKEWICGDLSGSAGKSLKIIVQGDKAGVWRDFAGDAGGSNLLELWVQARSLPFQDALREAKEWLGEKGVRVEPRLRPSRERTYDKPSAAGVTYIASKAEFYLTADRQIPREIVTAFKIAMTKDETAIVFPYLSEHAPHPAQMLKMLKLERDEAGKKVTWTSKNTPKVLFGKHLVRPTDRYLLITEGEPDCLTWYAMMLAGVCCVSVPFGAKFEGKDGKDPNDEWIEFDWEFLSRFERIYLSMDEDEAGRKATNSIVKRMGREKCYVIRLPDKDANKLWCDGKKEALAKAFAEAKTQDPEVLKNTKEFEQAVLDRMYSTDPDAQRGIPLPFGKYPFHLRWNEWTAVTGMNASGKTQLLQFILVYLKSLGYSACIASLEVQVSQSLEFCIGKVVGHKRPAKEVAVNALRWLSTGFWWYDHTGNAKVEDVLAAFKYAYRRYGVKFFVIDSWMKLGIDGEDFKAQAAVLKYFGEFISECDVHLFVVIHPRKAKSDSDEIGKMDIKGSGQITDEAHNVLVVTRNKKKEKELEQMIKAGNSETDITSKRRAKPDTYLHVTKQRNDDGDEPTIDLWYLKECKQYFGHYRTNSMNFLEGQKPDDAAPPTPSPTSPDQPIDEDVPF